VERKKYGLNIAVQSPDDRDRLNQKIKLLTVMFPQEFPVQFSAVEAAVDLLLKEKVKTK